MPQVNASLEEIKSEDVKGRLTAIQENVLELDQEILNLRKQIDEKRGVVGASKAIADRVSQEMNLVQKKIDDQTVSVEEARIRIDQIQRIVYIIREIHRANEGELVTHRGKISGLEKAAEMAAKRFEDTKMKYERHQRMEEEEAQFNKSDSEKPKEEKPASAPQVPPVTLFEGKVRTRGKKKKGT